LLVPTHVYSLDCLALINAPDVDVHGFSHVTGGGLAANLDRVLPAGVDVEIDRSTWAPAPIFDLIGKLGGVEQFELERTLNMGVGMVALVSKSDVDNALAVLAARGVVAWGAGSVRSRSSARGAAQTTGRHVTAEGAAGRTQLVGSYRVS
jgi:phosphoribosylformylglycinamidine cyclo-ligase